VGTRLNTAWTELQGPTKKEMMTLQADDLIKVKMIEQDALRYCRLGNLC